MEATSRRSSYAPIRQEQAAATRLRIVEVAARLFETQGYGQTSVAQIARESGVSAQTVYDAFGTKRGLARAVLARATSGDDLSGLFQDLAAATDPQ